MTSPYVEKRPTVQAEKMSKDGVIQTPYGPREYKKGDWVVDNRGYQVVMSEEQFNAQYEKA